MTVLVVLEAIEGKRASPGDAVAIGARAAAAKGASLGLRAGERVPLDDLLRGTIVASANDAAVALAEHVAGSEREFARRMTARANQIGLATARFANATGHTADGHRMTAAEVAALSALLIERFPEAYKIFAERQFAFRGKSYENRNPTLGRVAGADGVKTGQTAQGGYGLAASAVRDGRRLILVINGLPSEAARAAEAAKLLEWGFRQPRR
jgi:D-alanyl-D-alanine carboxypeptidase (penicillin-binding protein 5/6)